MYLKQNRNITLFIFLLSASIFSSFSCFSKKKVTETAWEPPAFLVIDSLVCEKLSEDMRVFASRDDEVLPLFYLTDGIDAIIVENNSFIIFSKTKKVEKIDNRISLDKLRTDVYFIVILLEQDSYLGVNELSGIVDQIIPLSIPPKINKSNLQAKLGDDDLLDAKITHLKNISLGKKLRTNLSGIHLFDEYEYWLYWHLE